MQRLIDLKPGVRVLVVTRTAEAGFERVTECVVLLESMAPTHVFGRTQHGITSLHGQRHRASGRPGIDELHRFPRAAIEGRFA